MKITKFAVLAGTALLAASGAFAQATDDYGMPQGMYFRNEIGSDVAKVTGNAHKNEVDTNWRSEFAGIYDDITVGYTSEKLAFELSPQFGISDKTENYYDGNSYSASSGHGHSFNVNQIGHQNMNANNADANGTLNSDDTGWNYWSVDWDFRFTPFDIVDFYLNAGPDIVGSKLFARDTGWGACGLGSDGLAIVTKPIDGLRISGAIPFGYSINSTMNWMNAEVEDNWVTSDGALGYPRKGMGGSGYQFRLDLGADYTLASGLFGAGIKVNDVINAGYRQYGIYAGVNMGAIAANVGYNYAENYMTFDAFDDGLIKIGGKDIVAASVSFVAGDLKLMADVMSNLKKYQSVYDVYAGLKVAYDLVPGKFQADMLLGVAMDLGTNAHHGTDEQVNDLKFAMTTLNANFIDLYYSHYALEDIRATLYPTSTSPKVTTTYVGGNPANGLDTVTYEYLKKDDSTKSNDNVAASKNWQYYTALSRTMSNGQLDMTSAAKAALAVRIRPGFTYWTGHNEFGAHVNLVNFFDGDGSYQIKFPVYWKWTF